MEGGRIRRQATFSSLFPLDEKDAAQAVVFDSEVEGKRGEALVNRRDRLTTADQRWNGREMDEADAGLVSRRRERERGEEVMRGRRRGRWRRRRRRRERGRRGMESDGDEGTERRRRETERERGRGTKSERAREGGISA